MCTTCGCGLTPPARAPGERGEPESIVPVGLYEKILAGNDLTARHNREHFLARGILSVNLMGSPGAGKTAVLEATARAAAGRGWRLAAVSADLATDNDARRLEAAGIPSRTITTGQACHLDAALVHRSLHGFDLDGADVFFIENVGNLVCPAIYDLGQRANVVVLSIAEGEDKPLKYPVMFKAADLVLVTKTDLAGVLGVDLDRIDENLARVMPRPRALRLSARSGEGMAEWVEWLAALKGSLAHGAPAGAARLDPHHVHLHEGEPAHAHVHQHAHAHRHGAHTHSHPHTHAHVHDGSHAHVEQERAHAHEGGGEHRHAHTQDRRPAPPKARGKGAVGKRPRAASPAPATRKAAGKKAGARRPKSRR